MFLERYRVLDITRHRGHLCGKIFADLGADVIQVEPPSGDPARGSGPFVHDDPDPEKSLYWYAYNTNKRGITLNIEKEEGAKLLVELTRRAGFLIESFEPGYLDSLGLSYERLCAVNPGLIMVSMTPFGSTGPRSKFKDSELINLAMGGQMTLCGDADRAPLGFHIEQSYGLAAIYAAIAALAAHLYREKTGHGQHVDVSVQESVLLTTFNLCAFWELEGIHLKRQGARTMRGALTFRTCWPCQDGHISWRFFTGPWGRWTRSIVNWMEEEGQAGDLTEVPWECIDMNALSQEEVDRFETRFGAFFFKHTKGEIFQRALQRDVPLFPVNTPEDVLRDQQLRSRNFWQFFSNADLGLEIISPGPAFQPPQGTMPMQRAPRIGEHNEEIFEGELSLSKGTLNRLKGAGVL